MKYPTADLPDALLNAAVAKAEGLTHIFIACRSDALGDWVDTAIYKVPGKSYLIERRVPLYSSAWEHGGPIIEREKIDVCLTPSPNQYEVRAYHKWLARAFKHAPLRPTQKQINAASVWRHGPTPLHAAMSAYIASKFGKEVELP